MTKIKTQSHILLICRTALFAVLFVFGPSVSSQAAQAITLNRQTIHTVELEQHESTADAVVQSVKKQGDVPRVAEKETPLKKQVLGFYPYWIGDAYETYDFSPFSTVAYFGAELSKTGRISNRHDWPHTELITRAHEAGAKVVLATVLHNAKDLQTLLRSEENRDRAITNLVNEVKNANADGVNIDFESIDGDDRNNFTTFMSDLAEAFHDEIPESEVSLDVMGIDWEDTYDVEQLLSSVDYMMVMGYDYHWSSGPEAGPVAPLTQSDTWGWQSVAWSIDYYIEQAGGNADKLLLGVPYYGLDWRVRSGSFPNTSIGFADAKYFYEIQEELAEREIQASWDDESETPYYAYDDHQVWFENEESLDRKYDLVEEKDLAGIGIWALGYEGSYPELGTVLRNHFLGEPEKKVERPEARFITAAGVGGGPHIRAFLNDQRGSVDTKTPKNLFAYQSDFRGGVNVATGDVDGDGVDEFVTAPRKTGGPFVRVFERDGTERGIQVWPFVKNYRNGISIATGDVDGDGKSEIAVVPEQGEAARVKVYRYNSAQTIMGEWLAFGKAEVGGSIALGDVDRDGEDEIIVGAGPKGAPHVRIFEIDGTPLKYDFFAYDTSYRGGITVAAGDVDGDGKDDIITVPQTGRAEVKVYDYGKSRTVLKTWKAFDESVSGATIAAHDLNNDGKAEVIVGAGKGAEPRVIAFDLANDMKQEANFLAYDARFRGGVSVAVGQFDTVQIAKKPKK